MTLPTERDSALSRKAALAKARQSRRPSRLGQQAGAAAKPDYLVSADAGFPSLLKQTWQEALASADLPTAVDVLLSLAGHVPAEIGLRALPIAEACAMRVLFGKSWRSDGWAKGPAIGPDTAFLGEIGLNTSGRIVLRVPAKGPVDAEHDLVGGVLRVPWSTGDLLDYQAELAQVSERSQASVTDARKWLDEAGPDGQAGILDTLKEAARRTAPFVLYSGDRQYTNFRDRNTLTGKTLWPGHPDCTLSALATVPVALWSDSDVELVVGLTLLVRSAGFGRIEEANGTQITIEHVADLLERTRVLYNTVVGAKPLPSAACGQVAELNDLAQALAQRRREITAPVQLYREIHGALMHKTERVSAPPGGQARRIEAELGARLRDRLPVSGSTLAELGASLEASPGWLAQPHGEFGTGLESLIYETVSAATTAFDADFAMSRGIRSLPALITALREQDWPKIATWDIPHFFCCVVPQPSARRHFDGSTTHLADTAWAISSRMQYNSWHFLVANLPKAPEITARDYFVPPTLPDIAYYSDQHHHGHIAALVRFTIRSPQSVQVLGRPFNGFMDLRLLRCDGMPFGEQELLAAHSTSGFIAKATSLAATLVADGADIEITKFDSQWHWAKIAE